MTSARIVTPGQAMAMIPTITARAPRRIMDVDVDLNITGIPFVGSSPHRAVCYANLGRAQWRYCLADIRNQLGPAGCGCKPRPRGLRGVISGGGAGYPCQNSPPGWACSRPRNP